MHYHHTRLGARLHAHLRNLKEKHMANVPNQGSSARPIPPFRPQTGKSGTSQGEGGKTIFGMQKGGSRGTGKGAH